MEILNIPASQIYVDYKSNSRGEINDFDAEQLADSIRSVGLIHPVTVERSDPEVTDKPYTLVAGYTRLYAVVKFLNWVEIPATVTSEDAFLVMTEENMKRSNLSMYQEAIWLDRWKREKDLSYRQIAARLHVSNAWIQSRLKLLELDEETQRRASNNEVTAKEVIEKWRTENPDEHVRTLPPRIIAPRVPNKKSRRVRLNHEIQDVVRQLVDRGHIGSDVVVALNWVVGSVDDDTLRATFGDLDL